MRKSPKWMVLLDDRILEFLKEEGPHSPSQIAEDGRIPYGAQHVGNRCRKLAEHGLVRKVGKGTYLITDLGEQYLEGETDVSELNGNGEDKASAGT